MKTFVELREVDNLHEGVNKYDVSKVTEIRLSFCIEIRDPHPGIKSKWMVDIIYNEDEFEFWDPKVIMDRVQMFILRFIYNVDCLETDSEIISDLLYLETTDLTQLKFQFSRDDYYIQDDEFPDVDIKEYLISSIEGLEFELLRDCGRHDEWSSICENGFEVYMDHTLRQKWEYDYTAKFV